jgi:hypothetical protein
MFLNNPYSNYKPNLTFGQDNPITDNINNHYQHLKGNPIGGNSWNVQFYPNPRLPATMTKAGESLNIPPEPLPTNEIGIKFPQYSTASKAIVLQDQQGVQVGMADPYRDNPFKKWTYGIQYYSPYVGSNPKQEITPVIYPQAYRKEVWAADTVTFPQVNQRDTQDITELEMNYSCREDCEIPSYSLGTPVPTQNLIPNAPLPVNPIGMYPNIGYYTTREIGRNLNSFPQPVNPIVEIQRRKAGLPPTPILDDFMNDEYTREIVQSGFSIA